MTKTEYLVNQWVTTFNKSNYSVVWTELITVATPDNVVWGVANKEQLNFEWKQIPWKQSEI